MDQFEMVERLRKETGVSYEEARAALEAADWNLLDAVISLEQAGKVHASAHYTTEQPKDEPKVEPQKQGETFGDLCRRFWKWFCELVKKGNRNAICMEKNGVTNINLPITAFVILLLCCFWLIVPLMIVALFLGCRFSFRGPELGKDAYNDVMDKASEAADSVKREFRGETKND